MNIKTIIIPTLFLMTFTSWVLAEELKLAPPSQLAHTSPQMMSAGFWIDRHPSPDKLIMAPEDVLAFNNHVQNDLKLSKDVFAVTADLRVDGLLDELKKQITDFSEGFYSKKGVRNDPDMIERAKQNMYMTGIVAGVTPKYAVVVRLTDQRFWPTDEPLYEKPNDIDFDQLQNSGLDIGTPVAVVHTSRDRKWAYVYGPISDGWVKVDDIAFADKSNVMSFAQSNDFAIITTPYADIYTDEAMTHWIGRARMGVRLVLQSIAEDKAMVRIPSKDAQGKLQIIDGFIDRESVHVGYMPVTARTIYTEVFRWLNTPYGWGDMRGFVDCSRLIQSVYATMGINLPRDSKNQALTGIDTANFPEDATPKQKLDTLSNWKAGDLLTLKGHIMMYLGSINDAPYAIHATSGYREKGDEYDNMRVLMRVVVSDLSLGEGSRRGSLLKRIMKVVSIEKPASN